MNRYLWESSVIGTCTAKNQYRKFETHIPRKGIARPQFQFSCSCVRERFYISPRSICLFCCRKICGPIRGINKLLILGLGPCIPRKGIHKWDFRCSVCYTSMIPKTKIVKRRISISSLIFLYFAKYSLF
jgi:hypothetical protein